MRSGDLRYLSSLPDVQSSRVHLRWALRPALAALTESWTRGGESYDDLLDIDSLTYAHDSMSCKRRWSLMAQRKESRRIKSEITIRDNNQPRAVLFRAGFRGEEKAGAR